MDILATITAVAACFAVASFFFGRMTVKHEEGKSAGEIAENIKNINKNMDKLQMGIDDIRKNQLEIISRIASAEEAVKSAHKRLDRLEGKG